MVRFDGEVPALTKYMFGRWRYIDIFLGWPLTMCLDCCSKGKKVEEYLKAAEALNRPPELDVNTGMYSNHMSDLSQPCAFKQLFMLITLRFTAVKKRRATRWRKWDCGSLCSFDWLNNHSAYGDPENHCLPVPIRISQSSRSHKFVFFLCVSNPQTDIWGVGILVFIWHTYNCRENVLNWPSKVMCRRQMWHPVMKNNKTDKHENSWLANVSHCCLKKHVRSD